MGETEEERDNVGKLFENFVQASTCKGTLQAFNVLCRQLDLDPADSSTFYSSLKEKVTTWKAKALWTKLDKRMSHKEYKKGQACIGTKVSSVLSLFLLDTLQSKPYMFYSFPIFQTGPCFLFHFGMNSVSRVKYGIHLNYLF